MENYRRDDPWDAATWAELDKALLDEAERVRVARKVFRSEYLAAERGDAPSWVSTAHAEGFKGNKPLRIPEGARPFVEISVQFELTVAQAESENRLHTARTLARLAAKRLGRAEDRLVLNGAKVDGVVVTNAQDLESVLKLGAKTRLKSKVKPKTDARKLLDTVTKSIGKLAKKGWPDPYALICGRDLYTAAFSPLKDDSVETPERQLTGRLKHLVVSGVLGGHRGILVSLAGDSVTIYVAQEPCICLIGRGVTRQGNVYRFSAFERIQVAVRDKSAIVSLKL